MRSADGQLQHNAFALLAAGVSFVALFALWRGHHRLFLQAHGHTDAVMWINALWLACITFLPIATVLNISSGGQDRVSSGIYVAVVTIATGSAEVMGWQLRRHRLTPTDPEDADGRAEILSRALLPALSLVAFVVVLCAPRMYLWPMVLLLAERPLRRVLAAAGHSSAPD